MSEQSKSCRRVRQNEGKGFYYTRHFYSAVLCSGNGVRFASAATIVTYAFGSAIAAIPGGIIYMLMRAKVPKAWSILLSGAVIGLIEFLIGAGWAIPLGFVIGAAIAELLARIGNYKSFWMNAIGYAVYMMFFAAGDMTFRWYL